MSNDEKCYDVCVGKNLRLGTDEPVYTKSSCKRTINVILGHSYYEVFWQIHRIGLKCEIWVCFFCRLVLLQNVNIANKYSFIAEHGVLSVCTLAQCRTSMWKDSILVSSQDFGSDETNCQVACRCRSYFF